MRFAPLIVVASVWIGLCACVWTEETFAEALDASWQMASSRSRDGMEWSVYVEAERMPGRPAFLIETRFDDPPFVAAATLMEEMSEPGGSTKGETRRLVERTERGALVHTFVDLPFIFSDRELAIRIHHSNDPSTGIHRIDWIDENDALPPAGAGVLRLATEGYWEFRPNGSGGTSATYFSRAEVGGSLPDAIASRLMKNQAVDSVERLHRLLAERGRTHVAAPLAPTASTREDGAE